MKRKQQIYNIGLDIGTNSVGWAVLDQNNEIIKFKKRNMWGACLFDTAEAAADRRLHRGSRRRYNRRRERIQWLDTFFLDDVLKVDPVFKKRIKDISFLDREDKKAIVGKQIQYNLFEDDCYTDKEYFKQYPSVYHLRQMLCEEKEKQDPRLIYLALHHIIKYRGNFLYEGQNFTINDSQTILQKLELLFQELENYDIWMNDNQVYKMIEIFKERKSRTLKASYLQELDSMYTGKQYKAIFKLLLGLKAPIGDIFNETILDENDKKLTIQLSDVKYTEDKEKYEERLEGKMQIVNIAHEIYSWIELQEILGGESSISQAMIKKYKDHKRDLKGLKEIFLAYLSKQEYNEFFKNKDKKKIHYNAYVHNSGTVNQEVINKKIEQIIKKIIHKTWGIEVKDKIENVGEVDETVLTFLQKAKESKLLPKQTSTDNGVIPYQLHLQELEMILTNQMQYYPSLKENYEKLCLLVTFRMPYYIGPISPKQTSFSWAIRQKGMENERITPWNLKKVIDMDASAMEFIRRMTNTCTYLIQEDVLPKKSLYIAKYELFNELNKIRVNGKLLDTKTKMRIYKEIFLRKKKVTIKDIENFYQCEGIAVTEIKGMQKEVEFASSLEPWIDFITIFDEINHMNIAMIEDIILWLTVFEDTKICETKIKKEYTNITEKQVKDILKLKPKYKGWSRLSKKLLVDIKSETGHCILEVLEFSNDNFMQIINDKTLGFDKQLEEAMKQYKYTFTKEMLAELQGSPAIKRGIWQSLKIVEEITKVMKHEPKNIFVEFAREEGEKQRTTNRSKKLEEIYKTIKKEVSLYNETIAKELTGRNDLDQEKVYLYFLQMGKCMYTGKPLSIDNLSLYEVDHIIPRYLKKDDSIHNKVLVLKKENQRKSDDIVLKPEIINNQKNYWKKLKENGLISSLKYENLTRTHYPERMIEGFINRQLVETRQISKQVVKIMSDIFPSINVMPVRAPLISEFRKKHNIYKLREVNDYHHAHDAYIIALLGNYMIRRFPNIYQGKFNNFKEEFVNNSIVNNNYSMVLASMNKISYFAETGEVIWDPSKMKTIKKIFYYKDCYITKKLEPQTGKLFDVTVLPGDKQCDKGKTVAKVPVNKYRKDVKKYGGFSGLQNAYYYLVSYHKKKELESRIIGIPIYISMLGQEKEVAYLKMILKTKEIKILSNKIYKNQLILWKGQLHYLVGPEEVVNARQLTLDKEHTRILYENRKMIESIHYQEVDSNALNQVYDYILAKYENFYKTYASTINKFVTFREKFYSLPPRNKIHFIIQMLNISQAKSPSLNINFKSKIGLTDKEIKVLELPTDLFKERENRKNGKKLLGKDIVFIHQSITGMYQKEVSYELKNIDDN